MSRISDGWTESLPAYDPHLKRTVDVGFIAQPGELRVLVGGAVMVVELGSFEARSVKFESAEL